MPVERVQSLRAENPGDAVTAALEALEKKGTVQQVIALFDEILIYWTPKPKRETRTETRSS